MEIEHELTGALNTASPYSLVEGLGKETHSSVRLIVVMQVPPACGVLNAVRPQ